MLLVQFPHIFPSLRTQQRQENRLPLGLHIWSRVCLLRVGFCASVTESSFSFKRVYPKRFDKHNSTNKYDWLSKLWVRLVTRCRLYQISHVYMLFLHNVNIFNESDVKKKYFQWKSSPKMKPNSAVSLISFFFSPTATLRIVSIFFPPSFVSRFSRVSN